MNFCSGLKIQVRFSGWHWKVASSRPFLPFSRQRREFPHSWIPYFWFPVPPPLKKPHRRCVSLWTFSNSMSVFSTVSSSAVLLPDLFIASFFQSLTFWRTGSNQSWSLCPLPLCFSVEDARVFHSPLFLPQLSRVSAANVAFV